jgi:hypothetical protein
MNEAILRYPRTHHVEGSKLQPGDADLSQVPMATLTGQPLVIEEKLDGANAGVSFTPDGELRLQSRGHYLTGGPRERHFAMFKTWAAAHHQALYAVLGDRYVMYGEWLYAKHTVFYDRLPHWFMEFDLWDRREQVFLSTARRHALLREAPVVSVPVLYTGQGRDVGHLHSLVGPSLYKSEHWWSALLARAEADAVDAELAQAQTDPVSEAEGLYIKHERDGVVVGRYKFIRRSFLQAVAASDGHWFDRPILRNGLASGVDILAGS